MGMLADELESTFGKPEDTEAANRSKVPLDDINKDYCQCSGLTPVHDVERRFLLDYVRTVDRSIRGSVGSLNQTLRIVSAAKAQLAKARSWDDLKAFRKAITAFGRNIDIALKLLAEPDPQRAELRSMLADATVIVRQFKADFSDFAAAFDAMDANALDAAVTRLTQGTTAWAPLRARVPPLKREADDIRRRLAKPRNNPDCVPIPTVFCKTNYDDGCRPGSTTFDPKTCPEYCRKYPTPREAVCTANGYVNMSWTNKPEESFTPAPTKSAPFKPTRKSKGRFR
jgi:hypothetical protein